MTIVSPTVEFSARVSASDHEAFRSMFPMQGATSWFIRTALAAFLLRVDHNITAQQAVADAIGEMLPLNREDDMT